MRSSANHDLGAAVVCVVYGDLNILGLRLHENRGEIFQRVLLQLVRSIRGGLLRQHQRRQSSDVCIAALTMLARL